MPNGSFTGQPCLDTDRVSPFLRREQKRAWKAAPDALKILVAEDCDDSFALTELMLSTVLELTIPDHDSADGSSDIGQSAPRAGVRQLLRAVDGEAALEM